MTTMSNFEQLLNELAWMYGVYIGNSRVRDHYVAHGKAHLLGMYLKEYLPRVKRETRLEIGRHMAAGIRHGAQP